MTADRDGTGISHRLRAVIAASGRRRGVLLLIGAVIVGALAWFIGMDAWHAATIAGGVVGVGIIWLLVPDHPTQEWGGTEADAGGQRPEVMRLSWSLHPRRGRVRRVALDRVRGIARGRLAVRRLDLDDQAHAEAIVDLIGERAYLTLRENAGPTVPFRSLAHCVDRLESLDTSVSTAGPTPTGQRTPTDQRSSTDQRTPTEQRSSNENGAAPGHLPGRSITDAR